MAKYDKDIQVYENKDEGDKPDIMSDLAEAFGEKDMSSGVEAIRELNNPSNIQMKTELDKGSGEAFYFARLNILGDHFQSHVLKKYCVEEMSNRVSNDRKGRRESVEISRQQPETPRNRGFLGNLFG